jgi:hypothetical protein
MCPTHDGHTLPSVARQRQRATKNLAWHALDTLAELTRSDDEKIALRATKELLRLTAPELQPKRQRAQRGAPIPELEFEPCFEVDVEIESLLGAILRPSEPRRLSA